VLSIKLKKNINYKLLLIMNKISIINHFFFINYFISKFSIFNNVLYIKNGFIFSYFKNFEVVINFVFFIKKKLLLLFCNFLYSKIFLKVGLGFRKKYSKNMNLYILSIGRRYWVIIKSQPLCYFFNVRRRSIFFFQIQKEIYICIWIGLGYWGKKLFINIKV